MLARLSRDFGSDILATMSRILLTVSGTPPIILIPLSIWNIALSNSTEPRSLFPVRGRSKLFALVASSG
ncbi:Uncharacterised protein [Mycobacterium tuberculosis]|nr:Uncharacterised protein [Mycobacterium tuberculosis]